MPVARGQSFRASFSMIVKVSLFPVGSRHPWKENRVEFPRHPLRMSLRFDTRIIFRITDPGLPASVEFVIVENAMTPIYSMLVGRAP